MYMGIAIANSEYGSWLGVMTAAKVTMAMIAYRRHFRSCAVEITCASSRNMRITGNSNDSPNATIISETSDRYLSAVNVGVRSETPIFSRKFRAGSRVRNATTAPHANRNIDARTNGIAYFFSFGLRPGVMNRQSSKSQTGSASTMP